MKKTDDAIPAKTKDLGRATPTDYYALGIRNGRLDASLGIRLTCVANPAWAKYHAGYDEGHRAYAQERV